MNPSESRVSQVLSSLSHSELQELRSYVTALVKPQRKEKPRKGMVIPAKLRHGPVWKVRQPIKVDWRLMQHYHCSLCRRKLNYNELSVHAIPLHDHHYFIYPLPPTVPVQIIPMGARSFQRKRSLSYRLYEAVKQIPMDELMSAVREVWSSD